MIQRPSKPGGKTAPTSWFLFASLILSFAFLAGAGTPLSRHVPSAISELRLQPIGRLASSTRLNLAISLPWRHPDKLSRLLQDLYNPASPSFHHYLTPQQITAQFGPAEADYEAVASFAKTHGLTITAIHRNRMLLDVSGQVSAIEQALHVSLLTYHHPRESRDFYAPSSEPLLDLTVPVLHISGLDNFELPQPLMQAQEVTNSTDGIWPDSGSATNGLFIGGDFRAAYAPGVTLNGAGQTVGLLEFDGYYTNDIAAYETEAGLPGIAMTNVLLDGFDGVPDNFDAIVEVSLDIEMAISMAPGLSQVIVYEAGPNGNWHDMLNRMADDDLAGQLSCSWYIPFGTNDPVADQIFQQMAAQGQSMFAASGDHNAYPGLIPFPSTDPYVTLVGGTMLTTSGPEGNWVSETVWNTNNIGSGGGISTDYPIPTWQQAVNMSLNGGSATMRNVPDVALTAYNVYVIANNGMEYGVSGTSCAAPLWAGFAALVDQQAAASYLSPVGFLNPAIYMIGLGTNYSSCFHDIVTGNNTNFQSRSNFFAEPGYDLCTGWGTPNGQNLIDALTVNYEAGAPTISAQPQSQTVPFNASAAFYVEATGTFPLTFQWNFDGTNLINATNARLLLTNVQSDQAGTYYVLVSNSSGGVLSSNAVLTVGQPLPPTITAQPASQKSAVGATVIFSVAATGTLPLAYQWSFNQTNLVGATNDVLTISNAQIPQAGSYSVLVSNVVDSRTSATALLALSPGWSAAVAPSSVWSSVASSADGTKLVATVNDGFIFTSTNSGGIWAQSGAISNEWISVASSADGTKLAALVTDGGVYTSKNAGSSWVKTSAATGEWSSMACSANGDVLAAVRKQTGQQFAQLGSGALYVSSNSGSNWQNYGIAPASCPKSFADIAASSDGIRMVAVIDNGLIYISGNSGTTWAKTSAPSNSWSSVASSADGTALVAVAQTDKALCSGGVGQTNYAGPIYISTDSGGTWTEATAPAENWVSVASSADGTNLVVAARGGPIYISTDGGANWANSGAPSNEWSAVACSADGSILVATAGVANGPGQIYIQQTAPALSFTLSGGGLVFSWPTYWKGAVLTENSDLTGTNWTPVISVLSTNGNIQTTVAPSGDRAFYRLSYP